MRVFGPDTHVTEIVPLALGIDISKTRSNGIANGLKSVQPDTPPPQVAPAADPAEAVGPIHA